MATTTKVPSFTRREMEDTLSHTFTNPDLLWEALQASGNGVTSIGTRNVPDGNKRLAMLGRAVMQMAVMGVWYESGEKRRAGTEKLEGLLSKKNLDSLGRDLGLDRFINPNKNQKTFVYPVTMMATVEELVGAVYLDGGLESAARVMESWGLCESSKEVVDDYTRACFGASHCEEVIEEGEPKAIPVSVRYGVYVGSGSGKVGKKCNNSPGQLGETSAAPEILVIDDIKFGTKYIRDDWMIYGTSQTSAKRIDRIGLDTKGGILEMFLTGLYIRYTYESESKSPDKSVANITIRCIEWPILVVHGTTIRNPSPKELLLAVRDAIMEWVSAVDSMLNAEAEAENIRRLAALEIENTRRLAALEISNNNRLAAREAEIARRYGPYCRHLSWQDKERLNNLPGKVTWTSTGRDHIKEGGVVPREADDAQEANDREDGDFDSEDGGVMLEQEDVLEVRDQGKAAGELKPDDKGVKSGGFMMWL